MLPRLPPTRLNLKTIPNFDAIHCPTWCLAQPIETRYLSDHFGVLCKIRAAVAAGVTRTWKLTLKIPRFCWGSQLGVLGESTWTQYAVLVPTIWMYSITVLYIICTLYIHTYHYIPVSYIQTHTHIYIYIYILLWYILYTYYIILLNLFSYFIYIVYAYYYYYFYYYLLLLCICSPWSWHNPSTSIDATFSAPARRWGESAAPQARRCLAAGGSDCPPLLGSWYPGVNVDIAVEKPWGTPFEKWSKFGFCTLNCWFTRG